MFVLCNVTINWLRLLRLVAPLLHWSSHEVLTTIFCWDPTHCMRVSAQSASTPTIRPTFLWTNRSLQKPFWIEIFLSLFMQKKCTGYTVVKLEPYIIDAKVAFLFRILDLWRRSKAPPSSGHVLADWVPELFKIIKCPSVLSTFKRFVKTSLQGSHKISWLINIDLFEFIFEQN